MNKQQKKVFIQVAVLAAACILIMVIGRIMTGNRFVISIPISGFDDTAPRAEDVQFEWENGREIPVEEISVKNGRELAIVLRPREPGDYGMTVSSGSGAVRFYDELHVSSFGTTYSMQTRNFTGDNAVLAGITLFFAGLAVISLARFVSLRGPLLYSYDAIWTCGLGIFCTVTGLDLINILIRRLGRACRAPRGGPGQQDKVVVLAQRVYPGVHRTSCEPNRAGSDLACDPGRHLRRDCDADRMNHNRMAMRV